MLFHLFLVKKIEMLMKFRFSVWVFFLQKDCSSKEEYLNYRRESVGQNLFLSFITLSGKWNAETSEVNVKASMRIKKSLCGSAAVFPESRKAGQGAAFFCMHPPQYTVFSSRKIHYFCCLNPLTAQTHMGWQEASLFKVLN